MEVVESRLAVENAGERQTLAADCKMLVGIGTEWIAAVGYSLVAEPAAYTCVTAEGRLGPVTVDMDTNSLVADMHHVHPVLGRLGPLVYPHN
jgi:hypothetical protein